MASQDHVSPASHSIQLDAGWTVWRWFLLRGAGFPAALIKGLSAPASTSIADRLIRAEDAAAAARARAIAALEEVLETSSGKDRDTPVRALKQLRRGVVPPAGNRTLDALRACDTAVAEARTELARLFAQDSLHISEALRAVANDARFREACLWQNRHAVRTAIDRVARGEASDRNRHRQHEQLVARYLQRYCLKNDTIGFFGPIAWGGFVGGDENPAVSPGHELLAKRTVYFEHWGIEELAARASVDRELLHHIAPRRMPTVRIEGNCLCHGLSRTEIPDEIAIVLASCDGVRTAREVADSVLASSRQFEDVDEVYSLLEELQERKLLIWALQIPAATAFPERTLRELVARAETPGAVAALADLGQLEAARDKVQAAAGDPSQLELALDSLDATFVGLTGRDATRKAGQTYAGRTLVYEDCRRALDVHFSQQFAAHLGPALSVLCTTARWYTFAVAGRFRSAFEGVYEQLRLATGQDTLEYARFFDRAADLLPSETGETGDLVGQVLDELQARWRSVIDDADPEQRELRLASRTLSPLVADRFVAPGPGWPTARFHAPDLMVAAPSAEHAMRGDGLFVLGEVHTGRNTLTNPIWLKECSFAEELLRADRQDVPECRIRHVLPKSLATRVDFGPCIDRDYDVETGTTMSHLPRERVLAAADLVVERGAKSLVVRSRDGRAAVDIIAFFELYLQVATQARFDLFAPTRHRPRVVIDKLVIAREQWRFTPSDLPFAACSYGIDQFVNVRRWAASHGIPDFVFIRIPEERKPVFVDLTSPLYVDILAKLARRASRLTVSEMLPGVDDLWLPDGDGQLYTCELRLTTVDPLSWQPPAGELQG
jgi:DNA-directed RNA polymerase subunit K/omega